MTTVLTTPELAAEINTRVETRRKNILASIECWQKYVAEQHQKLETVEQDVLAEFAKKEEALARLRAAGFRFETYEWSTSIDVFTTESELKNIYRAIGRLDPQTVNKNVEDARKKLVKVSIKAVKFSNVTVHYTKKLRKTDRCRIETVRETRRQLVCGR